MKRWTGGLLIISLALVLAMRYTFMQKSPKKQSVYDFFNNHSVNNGDLEGIVGNHNTHLSRVKGKKTDNLRVRSHLVDFEGLDELYSLKNVSKKESKPLLVWYQMRTLLSRSDALSETAQGIREGAVAWNELFMTIEKYKKASFDNHKNCSYSIDTLDTAKLMNCSVLQIPCGLIEDSSITVIGIPNTEESSFRIKLIGSQLQKDLIPPVILDYHVFPQGENLTKEPSIIQNTWTKESGWGNEEKCPNHSSVDNEKVDGLVKCNAQLVRRTLEEDSNATYLKGDKLTNISRGNVDANANFPFFEGTPFTATLWAGLEGFHMTVNGRHETSFAYREKFEPSLAGEVKVEGALNVLWILAKGLPLPADLDLTADIEYLKAPTESKKRLVMLIGVFSTGNNFARRMALRRSWMQYQAVRSGEVAVRFFIGLDKNKQVNVELWKEAQAFGDIQLMPFVDYYSLLSLKTVAICIMGVKILPAKYIMKTDDDAFLRIDEVLLYLKGKVSRGLLLGRIAFESAPHRNKDNKWYISTEEWPHDSYPPWAHGPGYIISRDIAKYIVKGHENRDLMLFKLEDVAMGIWIEQFKKDGHSVEYVSEDRFQNAGCESNYILAHYQNPRMVLCLWEKLQNTHEASCCE